MPKLNKYKKDPRQRIWLNVDFMPNRCWRWNLHINERGYGKLQVGEKSLRAHRYSYEVFNGPIPQGEIIMHLCNNTKCVNPTHLEIGNQSINITEAYRR